MSQILRIRLESQGPRVLRGRRAERRHAHPPIQPEGRSSTYELGMYDVQGRERTLLVTGNPLRNRQGGIVGSFGVLKDITERKAREQALETRLLLDQAVSDPSGPWCGRGNSPRP